MGAIHPHQLREGEACAEELGDDRREGGTADPHSYEGNEDNIEDDVGHRCGDEVVEGAATIACGLENAHAGVVEDDPQTAGEVNPEILDCIRHDILRRPNQAKEQRRAHHANDRNEEAGKEGEGNGRVDGRRHLFVPLATEVAGDDDPRPHEDTADEADDQEDQAARRRDGGQGLLAEDVAHNQGVHDVI